MERSDKQVTLVQTSLIPIRWGDMDAYRHVNSTVYFRYMEQVRVEYLERIGYAVQPRGRAPVIVNASCTFLIPLTYPATLDVRMFLGAPGRSSIPSYYEIRVQADERLYAAGAAKMVWTDVASGKSVSIPDDLRARLEHQDS